MQPIKDIEKVKRMFEQGQSTFIDNRTKCKYSMVAKCPNDSVWSSVVRIEKAGQSLSRVVFHCTTCFIDFEVNQEDIFIR